VQDVRLITLTPLAGSRDRVATTLARSIGDDDVLVMLSGPEGSGKSSVLAAVVATLAYGGMRVIRVNNPDGATMGQRELAARILGRPTKGSPAHLVAEAITDLIASTDDGQVVLVVDDADTLSDQAMELLLVVTLPARRGAKSPQLVLAGRGAFWERPWRDELRVVVEAAEKIMLEPLTAEDAREFVMAESTRLGGTVTGATPDALTALVGCSSGVTAQMERIVTAAVVLGNRRQAPILTEEIVDAAVMPDTLQEPPFAGAGHTSGESTVPAADVPALVARRKSPGVWLVLGAAVLMIVGGTSIGLVQVLRTRTTSTADRTAPSTPPAPATTPMNAASTAAASPEPARIAQDAQPRPAHETGMGTPNAATPTTPDTAAPTTAPTASRQRSTSIPTATPSVSPSTSVVSKSEPLRAKEADRPPAADTASGEPPVASAPLTATPSDRAADATAQTVASEGGERQTATRSAPSDQAAAPVRAAETATPEALTAPPAAATPSATTPSAAAPSGAIQPAATPPMASPPVAAADIRPTVTVPPPAEQKTPPPQTPTSPDSASLPASVISVLLQLGNEKLVLGDIPSARLYFERAAAAGSEDGQMGAAKTYDPGYLKTVDAHGLQPDVKRALDWYRIAATTHGNREAQTRIDALTATSAQ
jgi:type II secretory pathway predicted ATPase ExeA